MQFNSKICRAVHLCEGEKNQVYRYKSGKNWIFWECGVATKKANAILGDINRDITLRSWEVIFFSVCCASQSTPGILYGCHNTKRM